MGFSTTQKLELLQRAFDESVEKIKYSKKARRKYPEESEKYEASIEGHKDAYKDAEKRKLNHTKTLQKLERYSALARWL